MSLDSGNQDTYNRIGVSILHRNEDEKFILRDTEVKCTNQNTHGTFEVSSLYGNEDMDFIDQDIEYTDTHGTFEVSNTVFYQCDLEKSDDKQNIDQRRFINNQKEINADDRAKKKAQKKSAKKKRVHKAKVKESRLKTLLSALPGDMAMFIIFSRFGKEYTCGLVKRISEDLLLNLVETSNDLYRKYVDFSDPIGKLQLKNQIKIGHYALVYKSDDNWESFGIPSDLTSRFNGFIKSSFLPSPNLNDSCLGRVTMYIKGKGKSLDIEVNCDATAKDFLSRMRDEDEELEKTDEQLMAEEEEARLAAEEKAYDDMVMNEFLTWQISQLKSVKELESHCVLDELKPIKQEKSQIHNMKQQMKLNNTIPLNKFLNIRKAEIKDQFLKTICPQTQDVERYPFGCRFSNCRFSGHPIDWDPKENKRKYKIARKDAAAQLIKNDIKTIEYDGMITETNEYHILMNEYHYKLVKDDIKLGEDDIKLGEDDIKLGEDDIKLGEDDIKLGEDDIKLDEDDIVINNRSKYCIKCKFKLRCSRRNTCVFVHPDQLCRHGFDVCNDEICIFFENYKQIHNK